MRYRIQSSEIQTGTFNKELFILNSENSLVIDEIRRLEREIQIGNKDKQNIKAAIIFLVRNINKLKEAVKRENAKTQEFVNEVSHLVERHSPRPMSPLSVRSSYEN